MWYTIVTVVHVAVCFFLATVVLLQQGKGSDVSAVFGGSSQTLFGSSGAGNLLTKLTSASAVIFMITSLTLTYGAAKQTTKSLFDSAPVSAPAPASTATPENAPAAQSEATPEAQGTAASSTPPTATPPVTASGESPQTAAAPGAVPPSSAPAPTAPAAQPVSPATPPGPAAK